MYLRRPSRDKHLLISWQPVPGDQEISDDLPDEEVLITFATGTWQMFFDGAAKTTGAGVGIVFISPQKDILPYSFYLGKVCTNNAAEDEALMLWTTNCIGFRDQSSECLWRFRIDYQAVDNRI